MGFPGGSDVKESAYNAGDLSSIAGLGRSPGGRHGNSLQYSCLENSLGERSLVDYSPWGHKDSDMTERFSLSLHHVGLQIFSLNPFLRYSVSQSVQLLSRV